MNLENYNDENEVVEKCLGEGKSCNIKIIIGFLHDNSISLSVQSEKIIKSSLKIKKIKFYNVNTQF